jgi:galactose mutarotase-like enzyme
MFILENDFLKVEIQSKGAELNSIYSKKYKLEYLWNGDPAIWGKKSPVLFPVVGRLKDDKYYFEDKSYSLNRHGFARESEFAITEQTADRVKLSLNSNEETLKEFPFSFTFNIIYALLEDTVHVTYEVINRGDDIMYFSVGGHPAFKLPFEDGVTYNDYYLEFEKEESAERWPISPEGLIDLFPVRFLVGKRLSLSKELFYKDAVVFKHLKSSKLSLKSDKASHGIDFTFKGFPYLGIWAAKNADFVCIEPWCGIADSVNTTQQLKEKEGMNMLQAEQYFIRTWSVKVF